MLFSYKIPKKSTYTMASWPSTVSSSTPTISAASSATACKGGSTTHTWNSGTVTKAASTTSTGLKTYTCSKCGETETQTIPMTATVATCDHSVEISEEEDEDEGYTVTFAGDAGVASIGVYYTQDYTSVDETLTATGTTITRDGDT